MRPENLWAEARAQDSGGYTGEGRVEIPGVTIILLLFPINATVGRGGLLGVGRGSWPARAASLLSGGLGTARPCLSGARSVERGLYCGKSEDQPWGSGARLSPSRGRRAPRGGIRVDGVLRTVLAIRQTDSRHPLQQGRGWPQGRELCSQRCPAAATGPGALWAGSSHDQARTPADP